MNSANFNVKSVEELLKCSKDFQNKIRQELSLQAIESPIISDFRKQEQLSPVCDNVMLSSYGDRVFPDHHQHELSLSTKLNEGMKTSSKAAEPKANSKKMQSKSNSGLEVKDSLLSLKRIPASVGTKVTDKSRKKITSHLSSKHTTTSNLNVSPTNASKINLESNKLVATSSYRLPLQRFTEPTNKHIDFFKEHPDLELDMTSEQTTLFPRRFHKLTESLSQNVECVNVVRAEVKPPKKTPDVFKQETWNGILMQNKTSNKAANKVLSLKKNEKVNLERTPKILNLAHRPRIKESNESYDLISSIPSKGICTLQKHSERLEKRNKCHRQSFPVLYISPECQVQKLSSISIRGENESILGATTVENSKRNVKYFVCRHDDGGNGEQIIDFETITDGDKIDVKHNDGSNEANSRNNKFFKALEFRNLNEVLTTNSASSPFTHESSSSHRSFSLLSSSSSLKNGNLLKDVNEVHPSFRCPSRSLLSARITNDFVKSVSHRREVQVQTEIEPKKTVSTNTSPLYNPAQHSPQPEVSTSVHTNDTLNKIACLHKVENLVNDDIIAKIFERIRIDLPDALEVYKNRKTSTAIAFTNILPISPSDEEPSQEQKNQKPPNQRPPSIDESNVKLLQNVIEPPLRHVREEKREVNDRRTISQMTPIDCYNNFPTYIPGEHKDVLLQQNPLSLNNIKSSAVPNAMSEAESIRQEKYQYPTDAEIKCAVKIFIDSLSLDGCGGEKKAIINDISTKRRYMPLPKLDLISNRRLSKYTSSDSSNISNSVNKNNKIVRSVKKMKNKVLWCDISGSSTSTVLSSTDLESETDITNDLQSLSLYTNDSNKMSDGEIKSVGEI